MSKLTYSDQGLAISVEYDRMRFDGTRYGWTYQIIDEGNANTFPTILHEGSDLESPTYDPADALRSLVSFLSAWDESRRYSGDGGDNADLFPKSLHELADWSGWLDIAVMELNPSDEQ